MSARETAGPPSASEDILEGADASLLEIIDHVLNKGVMVHGELFLGVAGVDLIYLRVSAMLCAADKVLPSAATPASAARALSPEFKKKADSPLSTGALRGTGSPRGAPRKTPKRRAARRMGK